MPACSGWTRRCRCASTLPTWSRRPCCGPCPVVSRAEVQEDRERVAWLELIQDRVLIDKEREHHADKRDVKREQDLQDAWRIRRRTGRATSQPAIFLRAKRLPFADDMQPRPLPTPARLRPIQSKPRRRVRIIITMRPARRPCLEDARSQRPTDKRNKTENACVSTRSRGCGRICQPGAIY